MKQTNFHHKDTEDTKSEKPNRRWTQIYTDFGLGFEYAIDRWKIPATSVADE
jgi:hypothetical protein